MEVRTLSIEAKTDKAIKELEQLRSELKKLGEQVDNNNKETKDGLKSVKKSTDGVKGAVKGVGSAIKKAGIGLFIASFQKVQEIFKTSQPVVDAMNTAFGMLGIAFADFVEFVNNNIGVVVKGFKSIFEDPLGAIKDLGLAIKNSIVERFNSLLDTLGFVGKAITKVLEGDFKGALEETKNAGKEFVDVLTGIDGSADKIAKAVTKATKATINYTTSLYEGAKAGVELAKQSEIAEIQVARLIQQYDQQAEKLRQVRDDERNTIDERIKANEDLGKTLEEQERLMLRQVQIQIDAAQRTYDRTKNQEDLLRLLNAQREREDVLAQIEGFRSEQLINQMNLQREALELAKARQDAESERFRSAEEFNAMQIESEYYRLEALKEVFAIEDEIREKQLRDQLARTKFGTQAQVDAQNELFGFLEEKRQRDVQNEKLTAENKKQLTTNALNDLMTIVGKNSKFGKAIAVVQAIRDTYAGANKALSASPPPFNFISAAATVAAGIQNVRQITSTKEPQAPAGVSLGGSIGSGAITTTAPSFNVIGDTGTNQLADAIAEQSKEPIKAYVVSNDVTSAQSLDRNIVSEATL